MNSNSPRYSGVDVPPTKLERLFTFLSILLLILFFPIALFLCFRVVKQYQRAIVLRLGHKRFNAPSGPGIIFIIPCIDQVYLMDLRTRSFDVPPQEVLTSDSVTITVDAVVYFHVRQPQNCLLSVQSYWFATHLLSVSTLRNVLGMHTLAEVLTNREAVSIATRYTLEELTNRWGIQVERVEIKDVSLPYDLQKAMAAEAEGVRLAKAKIIAAEGEIKAAENLKEASKIMMETPSILQLRYLQTLNFIASEKPVSIMFPFPMDFNNTLLCNSNTFCGNACQCSGGESCHSVNKPSRTMESKDSRPNAASTKNHSFHTDVQTNRLVQYALVPNNLQANVYCQYENEIDNNTISRSKMINEVKSDYVDCSLQRHIQSMDCSVSPLFNTLTDDRFQHHSTGSNFVSENITAHAATTIADASYQCKVETADQQISCNFTIPPFSVDSSPVSIDRTCQNKVCSSSMPVSKARVRNPALFNRFDLPVSLPKERYSPNMERTWKQEDVVRGPKPSPKPSRTIATRPSTPYRSRPTTKRPE